MSNKSEFALKEEVILDFWREKKIFEESLAKKSKKGNFVFYDGPPFATGRMHYGHILGSTAKDLFGRYKTMRGYHVPRKWGWDCHGLPIENIVEKDLGVAGHVEIDKLGIEKFVEHARSKVLQYDKDWEKDVERIGRWVDFRGGYKTMDNTFMESVWWALSEINKKGLIYEGVRVLAYCPRCETPIANSEIAMDNSYKDITDISVYVKFELENEPGTYLIAWTTTPWTLPGNTAIAINKNIQYVKVSVGDEKYILSKDSLNNVFKNKEYVLLGDVSADDLIGLRYKPVFPYYLESHGGNKNIWKVWHADFVTTEKGTGIAHEAPAFGEEDMQLAKENDIPWIVHVDESGRFKPEVKDFSGMMVKPKSSEKDGHQVTDIEIIKYLANRTPALLFAKEKIVHSYPHCMRCETPIIYYALPSWFIKISEVKNNLLKRARDMEWVPAHFKEGRFKHNLENAPDWNISRNRYWATPLPIWKCECGNVDFVSSLEDLKNKSIKSGNRYFVMRHGLTDNNVNDVVSYAAEAGDSLNEDGIRMAKASAEKIKRQKIDLIITSPFTRTKQTAEIVRSVLDLPTSSVIEDFDLREMNPGKFDGQSWEEFHYFVKSLGSDWFTSKSTEGESFSDVKLRTARVLYGLEKKYQNKNILIVTHGSPAWLMFVNSGMFSPENKEYHPANTHAFVEDFKRFNNAEIRELPFIPVPHNANYELDMHRPYIDSIKLECSCGGEMNRITEVLDCWFESGSMPFAQDHYPFENKKWKKNNFPAGFVAEYVAQTRTWFYYTHAVSTIMFNQAPFMNVVTTGTLNAEDGQKMSKSKNNFPDPSLIFDKYGVDALRVYLMASPLMKGEDSNFVERSVQEMMSKVVGRLYNTFSFYELYRDTSIESDDIPKTNNVLDIWILSKLGQLSREVTMSLDKYDPAEAIRPILLFLDDLSTWYLRRCRDRIKDGDIQAKKTLYFVIKNLVRILAPVAPFATENIWLQLRRGDDVSSVHLSDWPQDTSLRGLKENSKVVENMDLVRRLVSLGLEMRHAKGIKVRQPLSKVMIGKFNLSEDYLRLIEDELNVKKVEQGYDHEISLDFEITKELEREGDYRELLRGIQELRKKIGLVPGDLVSAGVQVDEEGQLLIRDFSSQLTKVAGIKDFIFADNDGEEVLVNGKAFKITLNK